MHKFKIWNVKERLWATKYL